MRITLKINKSIDENAGIYFDKAKKAKKKIEGIKKILEKSKKDLLKMNSDLDAETKRHEEEKRQKQVKKEVRKKQWFEKFYWFISSDNFLIIGGRDATTNEVIIKKHTEEHDLVFHTDMAGSPFVVVKNPQKTEIPETTIKEAGDFVCTYSRAWRLGLTSNNVFYVKPEQVSKEANPGEFMGKGSFMIRGKTNYVHFPKMNLSIGIYDDAIMAGPTESVSKHCKTYVTIIQGEDKTSDVAKKVQKIIGGDLDDLVRVLPAGGCKIKQ